MNFKVLFWNKKDNLTDVVTQAENVTPVQSAGDGQVQLGDGRIVTLGAEKTETKPRQVIKAKLRDKQ